MNANMYALATALAHLFSARARSEYLFSLHTKQRGLVPQLRLQGSACMKASLNPSDPTGPAPRVWRCLGFGRMEPFDYVKIPVGQERRWPSVTLSQSVASNELS